MVMPGQALSWTAYRTLYTRNTVRVRLTVVRFPVSLILSCLSILTAPVPCHLCGIHFSVCRIVLFLYTPPPPFPGSEARPDQVSVPLDVLHAAEHAERRT